MNWNNITENSYKYLMKKGAKIDYDVFSYGFMAFINYFFYIVITIPIALFLDKFIEVLVFIFFFILLRRYIGGYHFDSKLLCLIFSVIFTLLIPYLAVSSNQINIYIRFFTLIIMIIITLVIKVVDHPNKRISEKEKILYTKKVLKIEILYSLLILCAYNENTYLYLNIVYFVLLFCTINILIAKIKMVK